MTAKLLKCCALAAAISASWQLTAAADNGRPSPATLESMGLPGMYVLSDEAAMSIRGFGFGSHAAAWGSSFAVVSSHGASAGSQNGYSGVGHHKASGENFSFAEIEVRHSGGGHGGKQPPKHGGKGGGGMKAPRNSGGNYGGGKVDSGKRGGGHQSGGGHKGGGGKMGGGHKGGGGHGGGKPVAKAVRAFAGGSSTAKVK